MKALGDSIHSLGLKFGIYSSPGPLTCGGYTASYQHELQDAQSFARWGVDYLKYDWCSYGQIAKDHSLPELKKPYFVMRDALDKVNRDIVYSLWSLLSAPLLIGCDLERLDDFTLNLLTNDEVIAVNQDILGKQATPVLIDGDIQVWVKELEDGTKAVGVFNLGNQIVDYKFVLSKAGLPEKVKVRDL